MTRITTKQNKIFKAYLKAYKEDIFDFETPISELQLRNGVTSRAIWDAMVTRYVSITSQLMMNPRSFSYLSGKGLQDLRNGFKYELNIYNIS